MWPADMASASATRDARQVSLRYFGLYRLIVASVFLVAVIVYGGRLTFGSAHLRLFTLVAAAYWLFAVFNHLRARALPWSFDVRLTLQVLVDIGALVLLMYASGGYRSGLAFMILIVLAASGLIGHGRLVVFYAAVAAVAVLLEQSYRMFVQGLGESGDFVPAAITSVGFFAVAVISRLVGRRLIANEELALRRGLDLSNQMRINERVIRDMQDGALVVDASGQVRQWNPRAEALLGLRLESVTPAGAVSPDLAEAVLQGRGREEHTVVLRSVDGLRDLAARIVPASDSGDMLVFLEDLGRVQQQARAVKLAALGRLTASIAHEIRNPLSAVTHAAELLRDEKRAETQVRLIRIINDNSQRIERLVRDVLELGRRDRRQPEDIELAPFLESFVDELAMQQPGCVERIALDCGEALRVRFDRVHLGQVLGNLVGNALRYCTNSPGAVSVHVQPSATSPGCIEVHVIDDGSGVPDPLRAQIFEPFVTTHSKGTGLGLYIARELSSANEAELELLDNAPGAHFRLTCQSANE